MTGGRYLFASARDGLLGSWLNAIGRVHEGSRAPVNALLLQATWGSVLLLLADFDELVQYFSFASWVFYSLTVAGVIVLHRKAPELNRPFKTPLYPFLPLLFVIFGVYLVLSAMIKAPLASSLSLGFVVLGLPAYLLTHHLCPARELAVSLEPVHGQQRRCE
mmetsp:Transcript_11437/g.24324  ORF Transcript_11437/g.24324 Transcript_11437/m.24324 type:complete len:162 (+) Transcript_11437:89-574(+)